MSAPQRHAQGEWDREIQAMLDRELSGPRLDSLREHLEACAQCREHRDETSRLRRLLESHHLPPADPLWPELEERLRREQSVSRRLTFAVATAAALVLGLAAGRTIGTAPTQLEMAAEISESTFWSAYGSSLAGDGDRLAGMYLSVSGPEEEQP